MKIQLKLDKRKETNQGYPIKIYVYLKKGSEKWIQTGHYTFLKDFNIEAFEPLKSHPNFIYLYEWIYTKKVEILKVKNTAAVENWSIEKIENVLKNENKESFTGFWKSLVEEYKNNDKKAWKTYELHLNVFKQYKSEVSFSEINYNFLITFRDYKLQNGCKTNGINAYLRTIRAVYNEAVKRDYFTPTSFKNQFLGVLKKTEKTKDKYFAIDEMKMILNNLNHNNPFNAPTIIGYNNTEKTKSKEYHYHNYFLLCFYLGGLDFIDIANLKYSEHVKKDRLIFKRFKGGNTYEWINNKIFPQAKAILDLYKDDSDFLINCHKLEYVNLRNNYNNRFAKWLKSIGVTSYFTTKTPRYTFIDIGKKLELNRDVIMELTGHTRGDIHSVYEGDFLDSTQDQVHEKIILSIH